MARRGAWAGLLLGVCLGHLWMADTLVEDRFGWGQGERMPRRIEVSFVRELAQSAVPVPDPTRRSLASPSRLPAVAASPEAASPPQAPASEPEPVSPPAAPAPVAAIAEPPPPSATLAPLASVPEVAAAAHADAAPPLPPTPALEASAQASAQAAVAASAPSSLAGTPQRQPFDWPPSTRLSYLLNGNYRGPVEGRAQVEWLRSGLRYQVSLEASVGPLLTRRLVSEGEVSEQGLVPRLLSGEQKVLLRAPRRWTLSFGPERILLADGRETDTLPGAQDEASQFVQLTWIFTTQPHLLKVGNTVEIPLALSRRLERWTFEVVAEELLYLPFGPVPTFHVKPRREAQGGDMTAQMWLAPTLQYLPVRILIHQDAQTYVDLKLEKPPLQAAR